MCVYVALRAAILITAFEQVVMANYELYPMGTMPKALSLGGDFPLYLYYDNAAGQLLTGLLAKLSFALFGETYLALKLVPASMGLAALVVVWAIANLLWGRRAAAVAAMAFALGPTELATKYSLLASGNHFENLFFTSLALFCHYGLQRSAASRRPRWLFAAGFSAGFALFVFLGAIIPVGLVVLANLGIRGWLDALRDLRHWLPGFLLGIAPLVLLNLLAGGGASGFLYAKFGAGGSASLAQVQERIQAFVSSDVFEAGFHGEWLGLDWRWPSALLLGCMAYAWLLALPAALGGVLAGLRGAFCWKREASAQAAAAHRLELAPLVFLAPLAALAFGLSDLRIDRWPAPLGVAGFRYFLPIFLTGILLLGALVGRSAGLWRKGAWLVAGLACLTGLWNLRYLDLANPQPGLGSKYAGYNFVQAARGLCGANHKLDQETRISYVDSFPDYFRRQLYRGLGYHEAQFQIIKDQQRAKQKGLLDWIRVSSLDLDALTAGYPPEMNAPIARGAGEGLRSLAQSGRAGFLALAPHLERLLQSKHALAPLVLEGSAVQGDCPPTSKRAAFLLERNLGLLSNVSPAVKPHVARGIGRMGGLLLARDLPGSGQRVLKIVNRLGGKLRPEVDRGLLQGLLEGREKPRWNVALEELVPPTRGARLRSEFEAALAQMQAR